MEPLHVIVLALIQGLTEFLPISSSAHLILPSQLLGWPDQGLAFDVAVHVGTLVAVVAYFRRDLLAMTTGWFGQFGSAGLNDDGRLAWLILLATVPVGVAGLLFHDMIGDYMRSMLVIAITTIVFGLALGWADFRSSHSRQLLQMTWQLALIIGCAQALALIPGTSRSGITMTAALFLGFSRSDAARFSFLLSIPVIFLSGLLEGISLIGVDDVPWGSILAGGLIAGVTAYLTIHFFLSFIKRLSMMPFVIYRLALGAILLLMVALA